MPTWKRNIFVRVVIKCMVEEGRTAEEYGGMEQTGLMLLEI